MNGVIELFNTLLPIFVMVVLPVMVVWLVTRARLKKNEQKMAVLVKAIENGVVSGYKKIEEMFVQAFLNQEKKVVKKGKKNDKK